MTKKCIYCGEVIKNPNINYCLKCGNVLWARGFAYKKYYK